MKTQVKNFSIRLLRDLIDNGTFTNITNYNRDLNVVSRFDFGIKQEMLYAIEKSSGEFTIFPNNIINTLIFEMGIRERKGLVRESRHIGLTEVSICILESDNREEITSFTLIVNKV